MLRILRIFTYVLVGGSLLIPLWSAIAAMSSSNYKINIDAVDSGGLRSTSTSYFIEDTAGEDASGVSSSTNYTMKAGYQQMYTSAISINSPVDVAMPAVGGLGGGMSTSSIVWTVITDNTAGYLLYVEASTAPALRTASSSSFNDYTPAGADPDFSFSILSTISAFGFTPEGTDIISRFKDNGSVCNLGSTHTADACWVGFATSTIPVAQSATSNHPSGTATTIKMRAQIGASKIQDSGAYSATITATAVVL